MSCRDWMSIAGIVVVLVSGVFCVGAIVIGIVQNARRKPLLDLPPLLWQVFVALWLIIAAVGVVGVMANPFLRFVPALRQCSTILEPKHRPSVGRGPSGQRVNTKEYLRGPGNAGGLDRSAGGEK